MQSRDNCNSALQAENQELKQLLMEMIEMGPRNREPAKKKLGWPPKVLGLLPRDLAVVEWLMPQESGQAMEDLLFPSRAKGCAEVMEEWLWDVLAVRQQQTLEMRTPWICWPREYSSFNYDDGPEPELLKGSLELPKLRQVVGSSTDKVSSWWTELVMEACADAEKWIRLDKRVLALIMPAMTATIKQEILMLRLATLAVKNVVDSNRDMSFKLNMAKQELQLPSKPTVSTVMLYADHVMAELHQIIPYSNRDAKLKGSSTRGKEGPLLDMWVQEPSPQRIPNQEWSEEGVQGQWWSIGYDAPGGFVEQLVYVNGNLEFPRNFELAEQFLAKIKRLAPMQEQTDGAVVDR
ncbi:unnamed protein product, partial [Symbiodinium sp. KB8]